MNTAAPRRTVYVAANSNRSQTNNSQLRSILKSKIPSASAHSMSDRGHDDLNQEGGDNIDALQQSPLLRNLNLNLLGLGAGIPVPLTTTAIRNQRNSSSADMAVLSLSTLRVICAKCGTIKPVGEAPRSCCLAKQQRQQANKMNSQATQLMKIN